MRLSTRAERRKSRSLALPISPRSLNLTENDRQAHAGLGAHSKVSVHFRQSEADEERRLQFTGGSANPKILAFLALLIF